MTGSRIRRAAGAAVLAVMVCTTMAHAQTTYTWNGGASAAWGTAASWSPVRTTPATNDVLVFDGSVTAVTTATGLPTQTIGQLRVINNAAVTLSAAGTVTLTIGGGLGTDLSIASGTLALAGSNAIQIALSSGATGLVTGTFAVGAASGGIGHRLLATDAHSLTFQAGSACSTLAFFTGNLFGTTSLNSVDFASGSTYVATAGANPFGATAPNSVVTFQPGSTVLQKIAAGLSISGRSYANLTLDGNASYISSGGGNLTFQNLTLVSGSTWHHTGSGTATITVTGNLSGTSSDSLVLIPGSGGIQFNSGGTQIVGGGGGTGPILLLGALNVASGTTLAVAGRTVTLGGGSSMTVNGTFRIDTGGFITGPSDFTYGASSALIFNSSAKYNVNSGHVYWPPVSPPTIVVTSSSGGIAMNMARTVAGLLQAAAAVDSIRKITVSGTLEVQTGASFNSSPTYAAGSTLRYALSGTSAVGNEWLGGFQFAVGQGVPNHVTIASGTVLTSPFAQSVFGNLTISGGTLQLQQTLAPNGTVTISPGASLALNGFGMQVFGSSVVNDGTVVTGPASPDGAFLDFASGPAKSWTGSGTTGSPSAPIASLSLNNSLGLALGAASTVYVRQLTLTSGTITHSDRLVIGHPTLQASTRIGSGTLTGITGGSYDSAPTYAIGSAGYAVIYQYEGTARTTGFEIPASRAVRILSNRNRVGLALAGGDVRTDTLSLVDGIFNVGAANTVEIVAGGVARQTIGQLGAGTAAGTVRFLGSGAVLDSFAFNNVELAGGAVDFGLFSTLGGTLHVGAGGGVAAAHPPTYLAGSTLHYDASHALGGEWVAGTSGAGVPQDVNVAAGTLSFDPAAGATPRTALGGVTIGAGATLALGTVAGGDLHLHGAWLNQGTLIANGRTVVFDGAGGPAPSAIAAQARPAAAQDAGAQSLTGPTTFDGLTVTNPAGLTLADDQTVQQTLTLAGGPIVTGARTLRVLGPVVQTSGFIDGALRKTLTPSGGSGSVAFEIGDGSVSTPVDVDAHGATAAFDLIASTTAGDHSALASSSLDGTKSVNRFWTVTSPDGAGRYATLDLTFHFDPSEVDPGAATSTFAVFQYDAPHWTTTATGLRTATSTQATGIAALSDFAIGEPLISHVAAGPAPSCISNTTPCVTVPVTFQRVETNPALGLSVRIQLSSGLQLCTPGSPATSIHQGSWLDGTNNSFQVVDLGSGAYQVDQAILGPPCGVTTGGTVFTVDVTNSGADGAGSLAIADVTARDCSNADFPAAPGAAAAITVDRTAPAAIALGAAGRATGNAPAPAGTIDVLVSWTGQEVGASVAVYRKGFGGYPQFDENGGVEPAAPASPAAALSSGWALTPVAASGAPDRVATRDAWYYVAFVTDACGNVTASNRTGGTPNYHLGDAHDGATACTGDNLVNTADLSFLGAHYGTMLAVNDPSECLDVGPTIDYSVTARPATDNRIDFEDLVVIAINYGQVSAPQARSAPAPAASDGLALRVPVTPAVGTAFEVPLAFTGTGAVQALSARIAYDPKVVEFLGVATGALAADPALPCAVLSPSAGRIDVAALGAGAGLRGEGELARARFRVIAAGDPAFALASVDARGHDNHPLTLDTRATPAGAAAPAVTALGPAGPTPFRDATTLSYALARGGHIELAVYSVDGRRIATLASGELAAGSYHAAWDGRDAQQRPAPAGVYYARLTTADGRFTRTLVRVR